MKITVAGLVVWNTLFGQPLQDRVEKLISLLQTLGFPCTEMKREDGRQKRERKTEREGKEVKIVTPIGW